NVIDTADRCRGDLAEFQAVVAAARLQNAIRLAERPVDVGDVAQSESDRIGVERAVGKRQLLGIAGRPGEAAQQAAIDGAVTAYAQHGGVDVAYGDIGGRTLPAL